MPWNKVAIVQVACGFARRPDDRADLAALSKVDHDRALAVIKELKSLSYNEDLELVLWTTGQVAWGRVADMPDLTLASLNAAGLRKFTCVEISQVPGLNAFSESYNAIKKAKAQGVETVIVVVSDFYLTAYRQMWQSAARRAGVSIEIIPVEHAKDVVSPAVVNFYQSLQPKILAWIAASCELGHWLARFLADKKTASRASIGFRLDGHTAIG